MRPGLSTRKGSKLSLTRLVSAARGRRLGLEHGQAGAHVRGGADHGGVAAVLVGGGAHRRFPGVVRRRQRQPQEAATPVVEDPSLDGVEDACRDPGAGRRRHRKPPHRAIPVAGEEGGVADLAPQRRRVRRTQFVEPAEALHQIAQGAAVDLHRRRRPFEAQRRHRPTRAGHPGDAGGSRHRGRQMGRPRYVRGRAEGRAHGFDGRRVAGAEDQDRARLLRRRQHLDGNFGHHGEGPEGARHELGEIEAGDVLDHPAARLEGLAAAAHRVEPQDMVARRAGLDAPGPGQVAGDGAADGPPARRATEERPQVRRLELQALAVPGQRRLDLGQGRRRAGGEDQFLGLVKPDTGKGAEVEPVAGLRGTPEGSLGARRQDLQRRLGGGRPADGFA